MKKKLAPTCKYCFKAVSKEGMVHTACKSRKELLDGIDDPTGSEPERQVDYFGTELP